MVLEVIYELEVDLCGIKTLQNFMTNLSAIVQLLNTYRRLSLVKISGHLWLGKVMRMRTSWPISNPHLAAFIIRHHAVIECGSLKGTSL
jgi:hypothetical protein